MKCLVIGAGGVGGSLAALLALAGNEVTCVARGEHKEKMLAHGLRFHSGIKGEQVVPCYVYDGTEERPGEIGVATAETYRGKAELILVCVKGYSVDSVADCIVRASGERTVVLPILNVYGSGPRIARACPGSRVIDGCIYIVGYISGRTRNRSPHVGGRGSESDSFGRHRPGYFCQMGIYQRDGRNGGFL